MYLPLCCLCLVGVAGFGSTSLPYLSDRSRNFKLVPVARRIPQRIGHFSFHKEEREDGPTDSVGYSLTHTLTHSRDDRYVAVMVVLVDSVLYSGTGGAAVRSITERLLPSLFHPLPVQQTIPTRARASERATEWLASWRYATSSRASRGFPRASRRRHGWFHPPPVA